MIFKFRFLGDNIVANIPDNEYWELRFNEYNDTGDEDCNLYLVYKDKLIMLSDVPELMDEVPGLPCREAGALYEEIVDIVYTKIACDPDLKVIDINAIESELIKQKYEKLWIDNGYF